MKVQIVGGLPPRENAEQRAACIEACRSIGRALALQNHTILLASEDPDVADLHVAAGASMAENRRPRVEVVVPADPERRGEGKGRFYVPFVNSPELSELVIREKYTQGPWSAAHLGGIKIADVLIVVGGGAKTENAAFAAPVLQTPVLSIPAFGGAAERVYDDFSVDLSNAGLTARDKERLKDPDPATIGDDAIAACRALVKHNPYRSSQSGTLTVFAIGALVAMALWYAVFSGSLPLSPLGQIFAATLLSATLGGVLRLGVDLAMPADGAQVLPFRTQATRLILGLLVSYVLLIVYLAGGLLLTWKADASIALDEIRPVVVSVSVIGVSAGFLLDKAIEKLSSKLSEVLSTRDKK